MLSKLKLEEKFQREHPSWWKNCPQGKKNIYTCLTCHRSIITIDVDRGTTPSHMACRATNLCKGRMMSGFYVRDIEVDANWEWYRPNKISDKDKEVYRHLTAGGLLLRKKTQDAEQ